METTNSITTVAMAAINSNGGAEDAGKQMIKISKKNKQGHSTNILKAAVVFFLRGRKVKAIQAETTNKDAAANFTKLVECMRPLSLPPAPESVLLATNKDMEEGVSEEKLIVEEDKEDAKKLASALPFSSSSSKCCDSRYASALNLQELDTRANEDEEEELDEVFDDTQGDAMIDMKAEMFIAQFYAQMRIQNIDDNSES